MNALRPSSLLLTAACVLLAGCNVSHQKNGNSDNVQVHVPFGDVHIKTNDDANVAGIGITSYPGAVPVKEHNDKDNDAADINLSFGDFHLGIKAASYQTTDSPDKVESFYRKDLARYGEVIKCRGSETIGQPTRTGQGLTCDSDRGHHDGSGHPELRAGSPGHLHIVSMEPEDGGTKFGLVALDLPNHHDSADSE